MTDKRGPTCAWLCAVLVTIASLLIAAGAARAVHAQTPPSAAKSSGGQSRLAPGDHALQLVLGGRTRTYLVHVPSAYAAAAGQQTPPAAKPLPVVFMLHGAGGSGKQVETQTGWDKKADKERFLAVFPDALPARLNQPASGLNPRFWRDGSGRGAAIGGNKSASIDDVAFIGGVLDDVAKRFPIDEKRVFVAGFSSGASMTFRLIVSPLLGVRIAAAAPVSGHLWVKDTPPPTHAVPILVLWGTADPVNPIEGGGNGSLAKPSLQADIAAYAKAIGATDKAAPISDEKGVKRVAYGPGKNGAELLVMTIDGAGHVWPGGKSALLAAVVGPQTDKINATDVIWQFFNRHFLAPRSTTP